ncbi:MAG: serine/threonine protein kinase [Vicinamibacteria bacterium]|jgi:serine/threonine-protein kinase|nr:serine/threonine protein kinase [Vicinamibacteria bacterium]
MKKFGRYEILDKLGEGAMGVVYRGLDATLGRLVALKVLSSEMEADEEILQRFRREAEAIGQLSHPNIVTVYDLGESDGQLYMAMELLDGCDLRKIIESRSHVSLTERVRMLTEICAGLGYAHGKGVIHRDIKPANIFVTREGTVKIVDFGLARLDAHAAITRRGVILGTPDYMSPEQAMGAAIDHRSDIFSTGAVFYELLTFEKPFIGKSLHSVLYQIISDSPTHILTLNPDIPARLAAVIHRMLLKKPERRPATLEDVRREINCSTAILAKTTSRTRAVPWQAQAAPSNAAARETKLLALLQETGSGRTDEAAQRALAELVLLAPDDPRVIRLIRERAR